MAVDLRRLLLRPAPACAPDSPTQGRVRLTFLGTAGFVLAGGGRTVALDPYVSRFGVWQTLFGRLTPDEDAVARHVPTADDVLVGHAHHDHAIDAPAVCRHSGARLVGSAAALNVGRAYGLPETQMVQAVPRERAALGSAWATALPSRHGKAFLGRVPLPGDIAAPPPWPPRLRDLRHGDVYNWLVEIAGVRVLHVDSADWIEEELVPADVLLLCAVGRQYRRDYTRGIVERVRPSVVVPCHWDDFTLPLGAPARQLPGVDVEGFVEEIRAAGATAVVLGPLQRWTC